MTDKQTIIRDIRREYGNMLNLRDACKALGVKDARTVMKFLEGVPYCDMGKEKKFLASDVGARIYSRLVISE